MDKLRLLSSVLLFAAIALMGFGVYELASGIMEGLPVRIAFGVAIIVLNLVTVVMNVRSLLAV